MRNVLRTVEQYERRQSMSPLAINGRLGLRQDAAKQHSSMAASSKLSFSLQSEAEANITGLKGKLTALEGFTTSLRSDLETVKVNAKEKLERMQSDFLESKEVLQQRLARAKEDVMVQQQAWDELNSEAVSSSSMMSASSSFSMILQDTLASSLNYYSSFVEEADVVSTMDDEIASVQKALQDLKSRQALNLEQREVLETQIADLIHCKQLFDDKWKQQQECGAGSMAARRNRKFQKKLSKGAEIHISMSLLKDLDRLQEDLLSLKKTLAEVKTENVSLRYAIQPQ